MKRIPELKALIDDLTAEKIDSDVDATPESEAIIRVEEDEDDTETITLKSSECVLVLATENTVARLFEAIGEPANASIELYDVTVPDEVKDALEKRFNAVDEG